MRADLHFAYATGFANSYVFVRKALLKMKDIKREIMYVNAYS